MAESPSKPKTVASEKRIIIIDDDESIVHLMKATLESEGFQVRTGRDGRDIVKKALEFRADLIVSDLMMPGAGGYDVIRLLQSDGVTRKIPVVLMTGFHADASTKNMMKQESNLAAYLEKPLRPEKLAAEVHRILNTISVRDSQKPQKPSGPAAGGDLNIDRWAF